MLQRTIKKDPDCARYVKGKQLTFQIQTVDGIGRHFKIRNGGIRSAGGLTQSPQFTMTFRNAAKGFATLSAKDGKDAFLGALRDEDLVINGDFVEVM